ncbi:DUF4249 family protein [Flexithrix dorotheae]|uniref:DUF4249 family protein n=1 Tax=Flexithrix dorotheae TaxID=70993 RepID=UPI000380CA68|nr:DUF4249 family protein [Flexithrix dorotheae]
MKNTISFLILIACSVYLTSCVDQIPVEEFAVPHQAKIAVEGLITSEQKAHTVKLHYSTDYGKVNQPPEPVEKALVTISDGQNNFELDEVSPGIYQTDSLVKGGVGVKYYLKIEWNGEVYEAEDEMQPINSHEQLTFVEEAGRMEFPYRPHLFGFDLPNKYDVTFFVPDSIVDANPDLPDWILQKKWTTKTFHTHPLMEPNGIFEFVATDHLIFNNPNYWVKQKKYSISPEYYNFLRAMFSETDWRGSLLDTTPGNVPTNLSNGAVGFFAACAVDSLLYPYPTVEK